MSNIRQVFVRLYFVIAEIQNTLVEHAVWVSGSHT